MAKNQLTIHPIHLGLGAVAIEQPKFTGVEWYEEYGKRTEKDGREGRLVAMHSFTDDWGVWEMHPEGDEVVICVEGEMNLIQVIDGAMKEVSLKPGEYAINLAGIWHTAKVKTRATGIFITAGLGTENRENLPEGVLKTKTESR